MAMLKDAMQSVSKVDIDAVSPEKVASPPSILVTKMAMKAAERPIKKVLLPSPVTKLGSEARAFGDDRVEEA